MAKVRTLFQLPNVGTFLENIAVRADGTLLVTAIHAPELWAINPTTGEGSVAATLPAPLQSLTGIVELTPDVFAIGAGQYDAAGSGAAPGTWEVWLLDLNDAGAKPRRVAKVPEATFFNGFAKLSSTVIFAADSTHGVVWKIDVASGAAEIAFDQPAFKVATDAPVPIGVNGLKVFRDHLYFTNTTQATFFRVPLEGGEAEEIVKGFPQDDFVIAEEGEGVAYITTHVLNTVLKVDLATRSVTTLAGHIESLEVAGATADAFGRGPGAGKLYVTTSGGLSAPVKGELTEPAKVVEIDLQ